MSANTKQAAKAKESPESGEAGARGPLVRVDGGGRGDGLRHAEGWRAGKPVEDPEKMKRWGLVTARPSEFLVHMRRGRVRDVSGQGASCFKLPGDSVAIVPTSIQRLQFTADQVTNEKVGVQVTGLAVYRIADPLVAFRMLNFSFPERAQEKLAELLREMFVGAARRLVANLSVEECLSKRKEGIAAELMREIAPVVAGRGKLEDPVDAGWGVILDTIEIQDVRVLSSTVFENMQARFRREQERQVREAELAKERFVHREETEAARQLSLQRLAAEEEVRQKKQLAEEQSRLEALAVEARVAEAKIVSEGALSTRRAQVELEKLQREQEAEVARQRMVLERMRREQEQTTARHAALLAERHQEAERLRAELQVVQARKALAETEVAIAELRVRKDGAHQELKLVKARALRDIENSVSAEVIQMTLAQQLPQVAAAFQQKMGEVHVTAVAGANPLGYIAAAVEGVMGLARSAGLKVPTASPPPPAQ
jgi:hypothetical protein